MADRGAGATAVDRLVMVYDADGGLVGEARYVVGHLLGRAECALCDISHGPVRRKAAFDELISSLPVPVDVVHRNEQHPEVAGATRGRLPCVAARSGTDWSLLVSADELRSCGGDVARFGDVLRAALADRPA